MYTEAVYHAHCCACTTCASQALPDNGTVTDQGENTPPASTDASQLPAGATRVFTYSVDIDLTKFGSAYEIEDFEQVVDEAFRTWSAVANIDFVKVEVDTVKTPDGTYRSGLGYYSHIDIQTTLGEGTALTGGRVIGLGGLRGGQGFAWMDAADTWTPYGGRRPFWAVTAHEIGHALGLGHLEGNGVQIMNPTLGNAQKGIYADDIAAVIASTGYGWGGTSFGAREWTEDADDAFFKFVKVGQTIDVKGGDDVVVGTTLDDMIYGGAGDDNIAASDGDDMIFDTLGKNTIDAGKNDDVVKGGSGKTDAKGGDGNDILMGGKGHDRLDGGNGNDTIRGDVLGSFFHGNDVIIAGKGQDFLEGGGGSDTFIFRPQDGVNTIAQLNIDTSNPSATTAVASDFEVGVDLIELRGFGFDDAEDAFANVSVVNGHAQFSANNTTIIFYDIGLGQGGLTQDDFVVA